MSGEEDRETRGGVTLSSRVWRLLGCAGDAAGVQVSVSKGSFLPPDSSSGSTHAGGGAFDLRTAGIGLTSSDAERLVHELRRRNVCAWVRDSRRGGFAPHIHGIVRDEPGLSSGARWQVSQYDRGRDGLAASGPDYHPRPAQAPYEEVDMAISREDAESIAEAVWSVKREQFPDRSTYGLLIDVRRRVDALGTAPAAPAPAPPGSLSDADVDRIAARVADVLATRIRS